MGYRLTDLLTILMEIELNFARLYKNVSSIEGQYNLQLKTAANVLSSQEVAHAEWYKQLILDISEENNCELKQEQYQTAKDMLMSFKLGIQKRQLGNIAELINFAVHYEKLNAETLKDISRNLMQFHLVQLFELFDRLILIEEEHSATLLKFLPKNGTV